MLPERNLIGKSAKSIFFEDINDIDIYIEDTEFGYEKLYTILFSRVFKEKYRVEKVFPLGGRKNVLEQYNSQIDSIIRPSLFVIDGDLFMLSGDTEINKRGLYKIPYYCIENILIDQNAIHNIMDEEESIKSKKELVEEFKFNEWISQNESKLFFLFLMYAISFKINPTEQTTKYKVKYLVSNNNGCINKAKLRTRIKHLRNLAILKVGKDDYNNTRNLVLSNFKNNNYNKIDVVSGKDYLFPLIKTRFKSISNTKISDINLKLRLARICDIDKIKNSLSYVALHDPTANVAK